MKNRLIIGLDVGSTTVKTVVLDPNTNEVLYSHYIRHKANQTKAVLTLMCDIRESFPEENFSLAVCGSGGESIANLADAYFIQEVIAGAIGVKKCYQDVRVTIEMGGQDGKVVFFRRDENTGRLSTEDMRMNGVCAGGTGAFIDQIGKILDVETAELENLASAGKTIYDISGRCGVFAVTDIQPLITQGVSKEDIALSAFYAIVKQIIGGLAQGKAFTPKILFAGGPFHFFPTLIKTFQEYLGLADEDIIVPRECEVFIAMGAALSVEELFYDKPSSFDLTETINILSRRVTEKEASFFSANSSANMMDIHSTPFFATSSDENAFLGRHRANKTTFTVPQGELNVYLGIDAGSTTCKFVLIDEEGNLVDSFYSNNKGNPLDVFKDNFIRLHDTYRERGTILNIKGAGSTGYGEELFAKAFQVDFHTVETMAHAEAAKKYCENVSFILDIGGQDIKAMFLHQGVINKIILNEACSAGCGAFIESYASSVGVPLDTIAKLAFASKTPSKLGSRCTVFTNSSITTEMKQGKSINDIMAGLCRSLVENVFTKIVRVRNITELGDTILVQGGTFKNDGVLKAFEEYVGQKVIRPPHPELMGAIGIALLAQKNIQENGKKSSAFFSIDDLRDLTYTSQTGNTCELCTNRCKRTIISFNKTTPYITGNRCERGAQLFDNNNLLNNTAHGRTKSKAEKPADLLKLHNKLLVSNNLSKTTIFHNSKPVIGIPRVLEFWNSLPYWKTLFNQLGYKVVISGTSSTTMFESGLQTVPSDTVCLPAKVAHGHIEDLIKKGAERIFFPMLILMDKENSSADSNAMCPVVQGYPMVIDNNMDLSKHGITLDYPIFYWFNPKLRNSQIRDFMENTYHVNRRDLKKAMNTAEEALAHFRYKMADEGRKVLESLEGTKDFAVVIAGRPYHSDQYLNHNIGWFFTNLGIPVLTLDALEGIHDQNVAASRVDNNIPFHTRMISAAKIVAKHPNLEMAQIISFSCGHDAVLSDEILRILQDGAGKELLMLKLDEGDVKGPLNLRVKSFVETLRNRRKVIAHTYTPLKEAYSVKFSKEDRDKKTILAPNLSDSFSYIISQIITGQGIKVVPVPIGGDRAFSLGKKFVHNDVCFPGLVNVGELLQEIQSDKYDPDELGVILSKNCDSCRSGQYQVLARKALDEAGYPQIPILTTGKDVKNMHPGFSMDLKIQIKMLFGLTFIGFLEQMRRAVRPYEVNKGDTDKVFETALKECSAGLVASNKKGYQALERAVQAFNDIEVNRTERKPLVCMVGEILVEYHHGANRNIIRYLEDNGLEVYLPPMLDFFRRDPMIRKEMAQRGLHPAPWLTILLADLEEGIYKYAYEKAFAIYKKFRYAEHSHSVHNLIKHIDGFVDKTYITGEGWLIPGIILEMADHGVHSFIITQPFACLSNHITGRGLIGAIKKRRPDIQIQALDFDPDTSIGNLENRLQMLVLNAKEMRRSHEGATTAAH